MRLPHRLCHHHLPLCRVCAMLATQGRIWCQRHTFFKEKQHVSRITSGYDRLRGAMIWRGWWLQSIKGNRSPAFISSIGRHGAQNFSPSWQFRRLFAALSADDDRAAIQLPVTYPC